MMAKWKKVASESQKKFSKDQVQYLFENVNVEEGFRDSEEVGANTLSNTTGQARQEAVEMPTIPLKPPPAPAQAPQKQEYD